MVWLAHSQAPCKLGQITYTTRRRIFSPDQQTGRIWCCRWLAGLTAIHASPTCRLQYPALPSLKLRRNTRAKLNACNRCWLDRTIDAAPHGMTFPDLMSSTLRSALVSSDQQDACPSRRVEGPRTCAAVTIAFPCKRVVWRDERAFREQPLPPTRGGLSAGRGRTCPSVAC